MSEPNILGVDKIAGDAGRTGILQFHVPEPHGRGLCNHETQAESNRAPLPASEHAAFVGGVRCGTPRPEQRDRFHSILQAPQMNICQPAIHLVSEKQIEHDVAMIHAPNGAVGVQLDADPRRAGDAMRAVHEAGSVRLILGGRAIKGKDHLRGKFADHGFALAKGG